MSSTIVFFGSGPVAAESLKLLNKSFTIEAAVTKPRPEHHKGSVPVLDVANELGIPVHTVQNKLQLKELASQHSLHSTIAVLIDFGIIVPQSVIDYFPLGIINSHFSLLPEWRGADPITFSVLSGQKATGVSLMMLVAGMDEGPLLAQSPYTLPSTITSPELTTDLIDLSYRMLVEILPDYISGNIGAYPQDASKEPTYSRKLLKNDSIVDWNKPAAQIEREVRAFANWPKTKASFGELELIITRSHVIDKSGKAGKATIIDKLPAVYCGEQALCLDSVKPAGKQEMTGDSFLAGYKQVFLG